MLFLSSMLLDGSDADFQCTISGRIHSCKPGFLAERFANQDQGRADFVLRARCICRQLAGERHDLFNLYDKSFKLRNMPYIPCWSMVCSQLCGSAYFSTLLQPSMPRDFFSDDHLTVSTEASSQLLFALHVFQQGSMTTSPGIERVRAFCYSPSQQVIVLSRTSSIASAIVYYRL